MTTRDKLIFVHAMSRHTSATVRQCEALMRYAGTLWRLERDYSLASIARRERIRRKVMELCFEIECPIPASVKAARASLIPSDETDANKCVAEFSQRLTIRTPKGEGICVPA